MSASVSLITSVTQSYFPAIQYQHRLSYLYVMTLPARKFSLPPDAGNCIYEHHPDPIADALLLHPLPINEKTCIHHYDTHPMSRDTRKGQLEGSMPTTSLFASTIRSAQWQHQDEGGFCVIIPAVSLSGGELKEALDSMFRGEYSVQV